MLISALNFSFQVEELVQDDSRVDRYPKLVKGESKVVWEWQGSKIFIWEAWILPKHISVVILCLTISQRSFVRTINLSSDIQLDASSVLVLASLELLSDLNTFFLISL